MKDGIRRKARLPLRLYISRFSFTEEIGMPTTSHRITSQERIAVIRSFHPARIERELLSQVFDLAQRGLADVATVNAVRSVTISEHDKKLTPNGSDDSEHRFHADAPESVA